MYKYLFGPVPSRRLGMSLGVDLVPKKVCSLDCVYCEVGKTTKLTCERKEYIPYNKIVEELKSYFENNPDPDYITFSGSGEPTLNSRLGDVIDFIKSQKKHIPIAVLTNGTLLHNPKVREELKNADVVLPSIDAISEEVFQKINRPAEGLKAKEYIDGLIEFRKIFEGEIWLEVFILPHYNLEEKEILKFKEIIEKVRPNLVQLNTLDRPGTVMNLQPASNEELSKIMETWGFENMKIISKTAQRKKVQSYRKDAETAILETIARRPCTLDDLVDILGMHINEINKYLDVLEADNKIKTIEQERGVFYQKK